jgi:putative ABC transport system permease protein
LGIANRAFRNISRRKIRALLVIIALGFSMAIMIAIPAGIAANQSATQNMTGNLSETISQTEASINQTLTEIDCSLTPQAPSGFGFSRSTNSDGPITIGSGPMGGGAGLGLGRAVFGGGPFGGGGSEPMNETYVADITDISGVAALAPILQVTQGHNQTVTPRFITSGNGPLPSDAPQMAQSFNITVPDYIIEGILLSSDLIENYPVLPTNITQGRNLQAGETGSVILSENNSAYFAKGLGDTVSIMEQDFEVVGIHGTSGVSDNQVLYMNLEDAQVLTNNTDKITSLRVFADSSDQVTSVASAISSLHPELQVTTAQQRLSQLQQMQSLYDSQLMNAEATMSQTQMQAFQEIVIAVAATSLIVLFVMLYTVRERTKEIGTLKAIGFSNRAVMGQFMLEGILLSTLAGVVGVAIGTVAAPFLSSILLPSVNPFGNAGGFRIVSASSSSATTVTVDVQLMLIAFGASILLGALGSLYPAWRASRTRPAEAMRYE